MAEDTEAVELISKLLDSLISCLQSLILGFTNDFKEVTENVGNELVSELKELIIFSPMLYIGYLKNETSEEEEE